MKFSQCLLLGLLGISTALIPLGTKATLIESNIPDLGQRSHLALTIETEEVLGQGVMQQIRASEQLVQDAVVDEYLNHLSFKLSNAIRKLDYKLDFKLRIFGFESDVLNAFAFLGGHVAVHTGLILALENEAELAAVLSHESAHIVQRHLARIFTTNKRLQPLTYAELLAALAIGVFGSPEAGSHLATAVMGSHVQRLINYTRDHEQEADRIGIQILAKAGFDPRAFPQVFRVLSQKSRYNENPPEYLLTHPVHESRIADSTNRLKNLAFEPAISEDPLDSLFFQLVRSRIEMNSLDTPKQRLKRVLDKRARHHYANKTIADYAYALALMKDKQFKEADEILRSLAASYPSVWIFPLTVAECALEASQVDEALVLLEPLIEQYPRLQPVVLKYTEALLASRPGNTTRGNTPKIGDNKVGDNLGAGARIGDNVNPNIGPNAVIGSHTAGESVIDRAKRAEKILNQQLKMYPQNVQILQGLVKSYGQLKQPVLLHKTQGAWHSARGEFAAALHQIDIALEYTESGSRIHKQLLAEKNKIMAVQDLQKKTKI